MLFCVKVYTLVNVSLPHCAHIDPIFMEYNLDTSRTFEVATLVGTSFFQRCAEIHEYSPFRDCRQRQYYAPNLCQFVYT